MLPSRWDSFRDLSKELNLLHRELDDMFRRTFGLNRNAAFESAGLGVPIVNTCVKEQRFYVEVEVPGVKKDRLDVSVDGNMLTISGERKSSRKVKEHEYIMREAHYGSFRRRLMLPEGVNAEKIQAGCKDGVLEISMPMEKKVSVAARSLSRGAKETSRRKSIEIMAATPGSNIRSPGAAHLDLDFDAVRAGGAFLRP